MTAMVAPAYLTILRQISDALDGSGVRWVVTGSFGFALQGLPVEPHDIDIQTDAIGAYEIARRLAAYAVRPVAFVESARIRSHLGGLQIDGIPVEIMGDIQKRSADGSWEPPVDLQRHRHEVEIDGMQIPVLSLTYERGAYHTLGRVATVHMLDAWLEAHPDAGD
jgi:Aminoglycoside-2''-adenylyltransferase